MVKAVPLTDWARMGATSLQITEERLSECGFEYIFETDVLPGFGFDNYLTGALEQNIHEPWTYFAKLVPQQGMILVVGFMSETDMIMARMLV